ncbi:KAT8 regulatory NSL complex subunit 1 [Planococcus citri]|uniref:KAT8 regulatory NSL complex subunit 1 n=1 Tax=Planococcus citri TaxID=170843 RepID=UPI0031F7B42F
MGFRLASLRRTNVVMAPACTCIIFVKDFSIFIEKDYQPISVSLRASDNFQTCVKQFQLMCVKVFYIIFIIKKTVRHVNSGEIFGCVRVIYLCKDVLNEKSVVYISDNNTYTLDAVNRIMNECDSMGDKKDNMGLQKIDMPNFDGNLSVKEKRFAPSVDILSTFEREMCRNGTNFQQDCEEFLHIMASNAEKAAPVAATTNGQVDPEPNNEVSSENLTSFERVLLNQVEDINMEEDHVTDTPVQNSVSYVEDGEEKRKKCLQMERRIERLTRRLKLKQSKVLGLHTSEQICSLLDFCRCKSSDGNNMIRNESNPPNSHSESAMDLYLKRLKRCSNQTCLPQNNEKFAYYFGSGAKETKNGRSFAGTVAPSLNLDVHEHIEKISGQLHAQIKAIANDFDSDATASSSGNDSLDEESSLPPPTAEDKSKKLPLSKRAIWRWLRNRASIAYRLSWLQSHMSALEYKIHHYTEIYKKLRSAKGQVVLLNNVTTDQNGAVVVKCTSTPGTPVSATTATAAAAATPAVTGATTHVILNGYHGSLTTSPVAVTTAATTTTTTSSAKTDSTMSPDYCPPTPTSCCDSDDACSRTRPFLRSKFRKRNIIRLDEMTQNNCTANAASGIGTCSKYGSTRCDCVAPLSCVLCVNRGPGVDLSNQHICSNLLPVQSKIALLEPTFHPVLSFAQDVSVSTHICALLNNDSVIEVCGKTIESRSYTPSNVLQKRHYANYKTTEEIRRSNSENLELYKRRKKYARRQPNNSQGLAYGRSQLGKRRLPKYLSDKALSFKKRRRKRLRTKRFRGHESGLDESADEGLYYKKEETLSSQPGSPHSSHSSTVKDPSTTLSTTNRRKRGQSYDIDNFIIPPNSTPAAVAVKPQYKEILIPTWKIVEETPIRLEDIDKDSIPDHILDDLDEDKIDKLHEILEQHERKKFRLNPTRNKGQRSRKRTDSCPETSEANTPERVASPVSTTSEVDTTTVTANLTVALTPITFPGQGTPVVSTATVSTNTNTTSTVKTTSLNKTKTNLDCDTSTVTESASPEIAPFEERKFPLTDAEYNEMLLEDPNKSDDEKETDDNEHTNDGKPNQIVSRDRSPCSESTDSVSEDPDDPDWMLNDELGGASIELIRK